MTTTTTGPDAPAAATNGSSPPPPPSALESSIYARAFGVLEEMEWLEALAERVDSVVAPVTGRRALMGVLHGRWLGHALHPPLRGLPGGFLAAVPGLGRAGGERGG